MIFKPNVKCTKSFSYKLNWKLIYPQNQIILIELL